MNFVSTGIYSLRHNPGDICNVITCLDDCTLLAGFTPDLTQYVTDNKVSNSVLLIKPITQSVRLAQP
jgi:hypothetical protein